MRITVERLRLWLLLGAGALLLVIAGFIGYARYRTHGLFKRLPARLGVDIKQSTNGFTYSQSVKGKTLFTIHASKAIQRRDGKVTLQDVRIEVHEGAGGDRVDRIQSKEFLYDQGAGVIQADGEVHMDLQAPGGKDSDEGSIHVKTSGLVFVQKLGVAATENPIDFEAKGVTGHAKGADYSMDTGQLILHSAVSASSQVRGKRVLLTASWAQLDRETQEVRLRQPRVVQDEQVAEAGRATVHMRQDGSAERIEAEDGVKLTSADGGLVTAAKSEARLDKVSQPEWAKLSGGVRFEQKDALRQTKGDAGEAVMEFGPQGTPKLGHLAGGVHVVETETRKATSRELLADAMDLRFEGEGRDTELRSADAKGGARVLTTSGGAKSEFAGEHLLAEFAQGGKTLRATAIHGEGHARMDETTAKGVRQTSVAEKMDLRLKDDAVQSGVLAGRVVLTQASATKGKAREMRAIGDRAELRADGMVELTGDPQVTDGTLTLEAASIRVQRESRHAWANGTVKASYLRGDDPVHVVADAAEWRQTDEVAVFKGAARPARMWQAQSQVEAPVIEMDRARQRATAGGGSVRTVLVGKSSGSPTPASRKETKEKVYRISAREMRYDEIQRQIEFTGLVRLESVDGRVSARSAVVTMLPAKEKAAAGREPAQGTGLGGAVDRVVTKGDVIIEQGERHGSGDELVYTAADGLAVLTGTPAEPPKVIDPRQGTVSGAALSFHAGDDSVVVSGAGERRVRAGTQVRP